MNKRHPWAELPDERDPGEVPGWLLATLALIIIGCLIALVVVGMVELAELLDQSDPTLTPVEEVTP